MTIRLVPTVVSARDKVASAEFFAEIFGLRVKPGHFAQVQINESLTFDFASEPDVSSALESHHYAFHVSDAEFDEIFGRVKARGVRYGSGPFNHTDSKTYSRRGSREFSLEDPYGHRLGVMTVPESGS